MKIAIASGKGGTGKTLVATNLFNTIKKQQRVLLIDCDSEEPNDQQFIKGNLTEEQIITQNIPVINEEKCSYCGKCQQFCTYHAIIVLPDLRKIKVIEDLCHSCGACSYSCKFGAITEKGKVIGTITKYEVDENSSLLESRSEIGVYSSVPLIKEAIKDANNDPIIILDSPPGTSCPFIATVEKADYVVLVTEPTPFGLNDLKLSVDVLKELKKKFGVIINRSDIGDESVNKYLEENNIQQLGKIPFDRKIAEKYSEGNLITDDSSEYNQTFKELFNSIKEQV